MGEDYPDESEEDDQATSLFLAPINIGTMEDNTDWTEDLDFGPVQVTFKLDTGAGANVLPYATLKAIMHRTQRGIESPPSSNEACSHRHWRGKGIRPKGTVRLPVRVRSRMSAGLPASTLQFYVTDERLAILGRRACEELGLVQRVDTIMASSPITALSPSRDDLIKEYHDVFSGIGAYERPYNIQLKENYTPVIQPERAIPYAKQEELRRKLDQLHRDGIIVVPRNGSTS